MLTTLKTLINISQPKENTFAFKLFLKFRNNQTINF